MDNQIWLLTNKNNSIQNDVKTINVNNCVDVMVAVTMSRDYDVEVIIDESCNKECQDMFNLLTTSIIIKEE